MIETGTRKSNIYDYKNRISQLKLLPISESSRLQRKGRVGRTGPGEVYYSYKQGDMENNKILFDFSTNNLSNDILNIITNYYTFASNFSNLNIPPIIKRNNLTNFQFHTKKSHTVGLSLIKNFCDIN